MREGTYFIDLIAEYEQRAEVLRGLDPKLIQRATAARDALREFFEELYEADLDITLSSARKMLSASYHLAHFVDELDESKTDASVYSRITRASAIMQNNRESIAFNFLFMSDLDDLKAALDSLDEFLDCEVRPHWRKNAEEERANQEPPKKRGRPRKAA
jgi:hypothetical protein